MINKIKNITDILIDLILPKDCKVTYIENLTLIELTEIIPNADELKSKKMFAVFQYRHKIAKKAIWEIKYNNNQKINEKFSKILYEFIIEKISDEAIFLNFDRPLLVPIPMHKDDYKKRGYNQSELITKEIYKIDQGINFDYADILIKNKHTLHQSELKNKNDRLKNLKNCFCIKSKITGRNIILIDDVITTGTTMDEARKILKTAGAKNVLGFSIAH